MSRSAKRKAKREREKQQRQAANIAVQPAAQPTQRLARPTLAARRRTVFLEALKLKGNATYAAQLAGASRTRFYRLRQRSQAFREMWDQAIEEACDLLELEARRRAIDGLPRKKFNRGEPVMDPETGRQYVEHEYSDGLLTLLLKAHRPEKFREKTSMELTGANGGDIVVKTIEVVHQTEDRDAEHGDTAPAPATDAAKTNDGSDVGGDAPA